MVKSYKGGYSILDTTTITFEAEDSGSIYDSFILEQLLEILAPHYNNYLRELKPIYLRYVTDDYGSAVTLCSLTRESNDFYIKGELGTNTLEIYVELGLDDDGNVIIESTGFEYYPLSLNVQNLIDGGNIQVGTKLYKHEIVFDNDNALSFLSSRNTQFTFDELVLEDCINPIFYDDTEGVSGLVLYLYNPTLCFYNNADVNIKVIDTTNYQISNYTVTLL